MRFAKAFRIVGPALALSLSSPAAADAAGDARRAIEGVFSASAAAWSAGNLDGFMASYQRSPDTISVGGAEIVRGYDAIRASNAPGFTAAPDGRRGVLTFQILEFRLLDPTHAYVLGRFRVSRTGKPDATGLSTLLFARQHGRWAIIADHS